MERPVVVCGLGRVGWRVLDFLRAAGAPVAVIDVHASPDDPRLAGIHYVKGDCRNPKHLETAGVPTARGVVIATSDDLVNVSTALLVRRLNPDGRVVVRMFNQSLIPRFGAAVRNTTALSVSALTAPLLVLSALTGESLGAFKLDAGPQQIAEVAVGEGSDLAGQRVADVAGRNRLLVLAHAPADGTARLFYDVSGDTTLSVGDQIVVCGRPDHLEPLLASGRGDLLGGVLWAGWLRRQSRTLRRTLREIDLSVKAGTLALFLTLFVSSLVFRFGLGTGWADGFYQTVSVVATGSDLHGEDKPDWAKVFIGGLKIAGAALLAAFTAIFTQYLLRARLGGALEARKIPDAGHVVVCGLGNVGFRCVEELVRMGKPVVAIERVADNTFAATVRRMGVPVIIGDATVAEVLRQARADTARAVIAASSSELANLEIALLVRESNPKQRVVVRLNDPDFAQAVREAAEVRLAVSVPALAAPAFAAALYGDRVHTLVSVGGRTLAVVELVVQPDDPCLHGTALGAAMIDYGFLPVAVAGRPPFAEAGIPRDYKLAAGDRLTAVIGLTDLDRLLRRQPAPADWGVEADAHPGGGGTLALPATGLTRGAAEELLAQVTREGVKARTVSHQ